jgi:hypothetical protein
MDPSMIRGVMRSNKAYDRSVLGVISTKPALAIGGTSGESANGKPVALSGRVPVKISQENGPVKKGDLLTSASAPGMAMKATKAGPILGIAMQDYNGPTGGTAMLFVTRGDTNGSSINELVARQVGQSDSDYSVGILNHFMKQADQVTQIENSYISDIVTDRVVAGLELVTPRLTADKVALNSLETASAENIQINSDVVINGTLTVDKIKANQIEGLEIFTGKLGSLEEKLAQDSQSSTESGDTAVLRTNTESGTMVSTNSGHMFIESGSVALDLSVEGIFTANGGLTVNGLAQFNGESIFDKLVTFSDKTLFKGDADFEGRATFNNDGGGFAVIRADQQEVRVNFSRPYDQIPVVTLTVKNAQFVQYAYKDLSENGFTIILKDPTEADIEFAWTALSVQSPRTVETNAN